LYTVYPYLGLGDTAPSSIVRCPKITVLLLFVGSRFKEFPVFAVIVDTDESPLIIK
jgi:hypothetical protein